MYREQLSLTVSRGLVPQCPSPTPARRSRSHLRAGRDRKALGRRAPQHNRPHGKRHRHPDVGNRRPGKINFQAGLLDGVPRRQQIDLTQLQRLPARTHSPPSPARTATRTAARSAIAVCAASNTTAGPVILRLPAPGCAREPEPVDLIMVHSRPGQPARSLHAEPAEPLLEASSIPTDRHPGHVKQTPGQRCVHPRIWTVVPQPSSREAVQTPPSSATCRPRQTHSATGDPVGPLQGKGIILQKGPRMAPAAMRYSRPVRPPTRRPCSPVPIARRSQPARPQRCPRAEPLPARDGDPRHRMPC